MGQTVNLLRIASVVRIHPPPPNIGSAFGRGRFCFCRAGVAGVWQSRQCPTADDAPRFSTRPVPGDHRSFLPAWVRVGLPFPFLVSVRNRTFVLFHGPILPLLRSKGNTTNKTCPGKFPGHVHFQGQPGFNPLGPQRLLCFPPLFGKILFR